MTSLMFSDISVFAVFSHEIQVIKENKGTLLKVMSTMTYESNFNKL